MPGSTLTDIVPHQCMTTMDRPQVGGLEGKCKCCQYLQHLLGLISAAHEAWQWTMSADAICIVYEGFVTLQGWGELIGRALWTCLTFFFHSSCRYARTATTGCCEW